MRVSENVVAFSILGWPRKFWIYHTDALAGKRPKKLQTPKPSMQTERYCLAVHKNTRKCTLEHARVDEQVAGKSLISLSSSFFLSFSYKTLRKDGLPTKTTS